MTDKTDSKEREVAEQWLRDRYGAYRGHFAWRELEEAFLAGRASLAVSAGSGPLMGCASLAASAGSVPLMGQPQEMPDLSALTERGAKAWAGVDAQGLRDGVASAESEPVAQAEGVFEFWWADHMPNATQEEAWREWCYLLRPGVVTVTHPSPPEGMVGGWIALPGTLPEPGAPVLLDIGKKYPIRAMWAAKFTLLVSLEDDSGFGEHDERTDEWYCPEGWYEWNEHEETHWRVTETPRAWAPLPPTTSAGSGKGE